jgi:hypothetical protein
VPQNTPTTASGPVTAIVLVDQPHGPAQLLEIISPAGFARFFVEFANLLDSALAKHDLIAGGGPD